MRMSKSMNISTALASNLIPKPKLQSVERIKQPFVFGKVQKTILMLGGGLCLGHLPEILECFFLSCVLQHIRKAFAKGTA